MGSDMDNSKFKCLILYSTIYSFFFVLLRFMLSFASLSLFSVFHSATCSLPFCIIQYLQLSSCFLPFAHSPSPSLSHFLLYLPVFHSLLFFHLLPLPSTGLHHRSIVESHNYRIGELHHVHSFFSPLHAHTSTYHYP